MTKEHPHNLTARVERAIVVNEHRAYSLHETGQLQREADLRLELDYLNRKYWEEHHKCFHHTYLADREVSK